MRLYGNEQIYTIRPLSAICESSINNDGIFLSGCLSLEHEFKAAIKEQEYIKTVIHILGNLNPEWTKKIEECLRCSKELEMPLSFDGEKYCAGIETMKIN